MTKKEKQVLIEDLFARLPYGVMVQVTRKEPVILGDGNEADEVKEPYDVFLTPDDHDLLTDFYNGDWIVDMKPYLIPLKKMGQETLQLIKNNLCQGFNLDRFFEGANNCGIDIHEISAVFNMLNGSLYDYRGLIDLGLAIEMEESCEQSEKCFEAKTKMLYPVISKNFNSNGINP